MSGTGSTDGTHERTEEVRPDANRTRTEPGAIAGTRYPATPLSRRTLLKVGGALAVASTAPAFAGRRAIAASRRQDGPPPADTEGRLSTFNYGGEFEQQLYSDAIKRFNERYPNVEVKDNFVPVEGWSAYANTLTTQIAGGNAPDVIHVAIEGTRLLVSKELLAPLDDFVAGDAALQTLLTDGTAPALVEAFRVDAKLYQLPVEWNNMVIYYNTKLLAEAGLAPPAAEWTWDQFLEMAKATTKGSGGDKVFGFGVPFFTFGLIPWFLTNGTYPLTDDWSDSNLNDPKVLEAVTFVHDLVRVHEVAPAVEGTDTGQLFSAGKLAMSGWGHWVIPGFTSSEFRDYDVQYWPRKTAATSVFGVGGWGISPESENQALAWELIKDLSGPDLQNATAAAGGGSIPTLRAAAENPAFLEAPPNAKIFYESLNDSKPVPSPNNFNEFEDIFMRHFGEIMSGGKTPEEGMNDAHEELSEAMAKLRS